MYFLSLSVFCPPPGAAAGQDPVSYTHLRLKQLRYMRLDAAAYALGTALLAAVIVLRCFGL